MEAVDDPAFVLVGNKLDLKDKRMVTFQQAKEFATRRGMQYLECSIKESLGFEEVMEYLVSRLVSKSVRQQESITLSKVNEESNPHSNNNNNDTSTCFNKC